MLSRLGRILLFLLGGGIVYSQLRTCFHDEGLLLRGYGSSSEVNDSAGYQQIFHQKKKTTGKRTAIAVTTLGIVSECEATRIRHLVETAGDTVDVWVLHSHYVLDALGHHDQTAYSRQIMASIPGLHQWPQSSTRFKIFDGNSGSSKGSFLLFLADHPEYDFAWHMESDVFFTGPWKDILEAEMKGDQTTDFLTTNIMDKAKGDNWYHLTGCKIADVSCKDLRACQVNWMLARVSYPLAKHLVQELFHRKIKGHHEAVIAPFCKLHKYTMAKIDPSKVGLLKSGHTNSTDVNEELASRRVAYYEPKRGTVVHPVKCDAYINSTYTMEDEIARWTTEQGWASGNGKAEELVFAGWGIEEPERVSLKTRAVGKLAAPLELVEEVRTSMRTTTKKPALRNQTL